MNIGKITLEKYAALAPMAGLGDRAFREICMKYGAVYCVGEMVSSKGLGYGNKKTADLLAMGEEERPCGIQLFGDNPSAMAKAAKLAMEYRPDVIDINMGCPAPKIAVNGSGAALMKNLSLAGEIIKAVVESIDIPVTVKIRKGWDDESVNAVEAALIAQDAGASAITVHGKTRMQMYTPPVSLDIIRQVKQAVAIPVIGNGEVDSVEKAEEMYNTTGCDLLMIGRGALGRPWIFGEIKEFLATGIVRPEPCREEKIDIMLEHISLACSYKGEKRAMLEARTHVAHYLKGFSGAAALRQRAGTLSTYDDLLQLADIWLEK